MDARPAATAAATVAASGRLGTAAVLRRLLALGVVLLVVSQLLLARSARTTAWTAALWRAAAGAAGGSGDVDYDPDAGAPIDAASWAAVLAGGGVGGDGGDDVPLDVDEAPAAAAVPAAAAASSGGNERNATVALRDDPLAAMLDLIENRLARPGGGGEGGGSGADDDGEGGDEDEEGAAAAGGDAEGDDYSSGKSGAAAAAARAGAAPGAPAAQAAGAPAAAPLPPPPPTVVPLGDMAAPDAKLLLSSADPEDDDAVRPPDDPDEPASPSRAPRRPGSPTPTPSTPTRRSLSEGHTLWRARYPPPAWLPPSQAHHRACRLENQYLHVVSSRGGFASLHAIVRDAMALAKALGRTFVEPCVRGGAIVPCWPGRVASLPASAADAVAAAALGGGGVNITADLDPLAVPAFAEACAGGDGAGAAAAAAAAPMPVKQLLKQLASRVVKAAADAGDGDAATAAAAAKKSPRPSPSPAVEVWRTPAQGRAYPLRLYFDVAALARAHYPRVVSFDDWLACALKRKKRRPGLIDTYVSRKAVGRVAADRAYCVTERGGPGRARVRDACHRVVGPYTFSSFWSPADSGVAVPAGPDREPFSGHMWRLYRDVLKADRGANVYLTEVWAGTLMPRGGPAGSPAGAGQPPPEPAPVGQPPFNDIHRHALRAWLKAGEPGGGDGRRYRPRPKPPAAAPPAKQRRPTFRFDDAGPSNNKAAGADGQLLLPDLGGSAFAAFHWATTGVPEWKLPACAQALARRTAALTGWREWVAPPPPPPPKGGKKKLGGTNATSPLPSLLPPPPFHPSAVLLADVAAPSNPCAASPGAGGGAGTAALRRPSPVRRKALEALLQGGGLRKYDADHPGLDAGVLAIREFLLARDARWYVTCHQPPPPSSSSAVGAVDALLGGGGGTGDGSDAADFECRACTRVDSPYVGALVSLRRARGKGAITSWFTGRPDSAS
jgi:hypothetical protein